MPHRSYYFCWSFEACCVRETAPEDGVFSAALPVHRWSGEEIERVRNVLRKLTALRIGNEADAEDLVQETLLTMTLKCPERGPDKGLLIWSMGILRKKIGNYYRKTRRYVPMECAHAGNGAHAIPSPELRYFQRELAALVNRILKDFPERERTPLKLCLAGLATREIAEALLPERYQNVVNRLFRGRRKMARQLAVYGYSQPIRPRRQKPPARTEARKCRSSGQAAANDIQIRPRS